MSEIVAWRYRWQHDTKWVHSSEEPEAYPNRIVEPLCVAGSVSYSTQPVAWLRHGEAVPVQGAPWGAMWITDKDDPKGFPVFSSGKNEQPSDACQHCNGNGITILLEGDRIGEYRCEYCTTGKEIDDDDLPF